MKGNSIQSKCAVCGHMVMIDEIRNGDKCSNCGWVQNIDGLEFPDRVERPNLVSLNKARELYKEGKPFMPDLDDFIDGYNFYGEMEFTYQGKTYMV